MKSQSEVWRENVERVKSLEQATRPAAERGTASTGSRPRPRLSLAGVEDYLDWLAGNVGSMHHLSVDAHLRAAELVIRTAANAAQAKATQHTLVQDGVIDAPGQ